MANSVIVGILRALLTANTGEFTAEFKKAVEAEKGLGEESKKLGDKLGELTPKAKRLVESFQGGRLLYNAKSLAQAVAEIGGVSKLTATEQARVNATVTEAIAKYAALGQTAPPHLKALARETAGAAAATNTWATQFQSANRLLGAFGASLSIGAVIAFSKSLLDMGDSIQKLADQTGQTTEDIQRFQFIASQSGNSIEDITRAIGFLQKSLGSSGPELKKVQKILEDIGISFDQFRRASSFEQLAELADAFAKIEDPAARAKAATLLFGRTGIEVLPTLVANFRQLGNEAPVASQQVIKALDQAGDQLGKFGLQIKVWAAESLNALSGGFDRMLVKIFEFGAQAAEFQAKLRDLASKIPGVSALFEHFGITAEQSRKDAQFFTDAAKAMQGQLDRLAEPAKKAAVAVQQFGDDSADAAKKAKELAEAIEALRGDFNKTADDIEAAVQKTFDEENLAAFKREIQEINEMFERLSDEAESLNRNIGTLDEQRKRELLGVNPPGVTIDENNRWKQHGVAIAGAVGDEIKTGLKRSFEEIPHFLTSSVLHSGSFINGLKALGVGIADAIAEPLLKQLGEKIASAAFWKTIGGAITGGGSKGSAIGGTVGGVIGGVVAGPVGAIVGGAIGSIFGRAEPIGSAGPGAVSSLAIRPMTIPDFAGPAAMLGNDMTAAAPQTVTPNVVVNNHINAINEQGVREFVYSDAFTRHLGGIFENNHGFVTTSLSRGQQGIR